MSKRHVLSRGAVSRRAVVAGGIGAAALIALPDAGARAATIRGNAAEAEAAASDTTYAFAYGTLNAAPHTGGSVAATPAPAAGGSSSGAANAQAALPAAVPVATVLAAAPVTSPDQSSTLLTTLDPVTGGQRATVTLVDKKTLATTARGTFDITGIPSGTNILITPVFAPGTTTIGLVLAITEPKPAGTMRKIDPVTREPGNYAATAYPSRHALAYFDTRTSAITGPFFLNDAGTLALTTVAANGTDLFVMTTPEPRPVPTKRIAAPVSQLRAFPHGSGKARFSVPAPGPWPGGEPVVTLASGDIARLVNGRTVQVFGAKDGDLSQHAVAPISASRAKPSAVTMQTRDDGTVFLTKPGIGKAVIADPGRGFRCVHEIAHPAPANPGGTPWSKAALSADGATLFTVGDARAGGLAAYDVKTGKLSGAYTGGEQYTGVYVMPSGSLLAVSGPANPRLSFFTSGLSPAGTSDTDMQVAAVY